MVASELLTHLGQGSPLENAGLLGLKCCKVPGCQIVETRFSDIAGIGVQRRNGWEAWIGPQGAGDNPSIQGSRLAHGLWELLVVVDTTTPGL